MLGQYGWMVDNGTVFRMFDDVHRNELRAKRHHVQVGADLLVLVDDLLQGLSLQAPPLELEHGNVVGFGGDGWREGSKSVKSNPE